MADELDNPDDGRSGANSDRAPGVDKDNGPGHEDRKVVIKIDRDSFKVDKETMTGAGLRLLPQPPIGADRDLFQVVPGGSDKKIADNEVVELKNGMRFFSAPAQINPGQEL